MIMRILQVNKFFYRRAGAEVVFFDTIDGLRKRGHEVSEFSMTHSENAPSEYAAYFAPPLAEFTSRQGKRAKIKAFKNLFHSQEIEKKLRTLILAAEPQVAHLHNVTRQLSASLFTALHTMKVPVVFTVHDVQPMCPNHRMLTKHHVCERCHIHKYYNTLRFKCINDSWSQSFAGMLEAYYFYLRGIWKWVDTFICPSEFMLEKMKQWGFPEAKLQLVRNPFPLKEEVPPLGQKIVYLGRLHEEKGIMTFMEATKELRNYRIVVAGNGPEDANVEKIIRQNGLNNVQRVGWVGGETWKKIMDSARVVVVPSLFYENCSITILEALSHGRLVVAADRGGNRELIINKETGFLSEPENPEALAESVREAMETDDISAYKIINNGRELLRKQHDPAFYFRELEKIYQSVIK
jgi:glycosyltransferase involved in cell wall biosynthesis